ncbi:DUF4147 domain-containing protein, partial [Escherichia coli]|uniref:DUF4147 domain-containing protein n=1 Tax=Escherichia coli TaxID=562 RepID=UPI00301D7A0A
MALVAENGWQGEDTGLVVTRYGHGAQGKKIEVVEAAHPVPDAAGLAVATRVLELISHLGEDDLLGCLAVTTDTSGYLKLVTWANSFGMLKRAGAGKAAAAMALVAENGWQGEDTGLVVTRYGHGAQGKK